jgi:hypothetical protein
MQKRIIFIFIAIVLILLAVSLAGYYFIIQNGTGGGNGSGGFSFKSFLPFGGDSNPPAEETGNDGGDNGNATTTGEAPDDFTRKLRELSSEPVAGAGVVDIKAGTIVRYIEKATGHIYEVQLFSPVHDRISNTTIPLAYDAIWTANASSTIARYLEDDDNTVDTYSLILKPNAGTATSTENTISGIAFPGGISDVSVYGNSVFYLQQSGAFSQGYISLIDGTKKKLIWSSALKELNSQFANDKIVALATKPYKGVDGFLYFVDTASGAVKKVLSGIPGLSALVSGNGTSVLYLEQDNNDLRLFSFDTQTGTATEITPQTFPEKCAWSRKDAAIAYCAVPRSTLNSDSLSDDIWKYDLKNGTSQIVENLETDAGQGIDVEKPLLSASEQYLVFINKADGSLWSLDLTK